MLKTWKYLYVVKKFQFLYLSKKYIKYNKKNIYQIMSAIK
jgi:hypothetical protein